MRQQGKKMKKMLTVVLYLAASVAWSQDSNEAENAEEEKVDLYISTIENINVTAEKPMTDFRADTNDDIDAILDAAEELENDEAEE